MSWMAVRYSSILFSGVPYIRFLILWAALNSLYHYHSGDIVKWSRAS